MTWQQLKAQHGATLVPWKPEYCILTTSKPIPQSVLLADKRKYKALMHYDTVSQINKLLIATGVANSAIINMLMGF